MKQKLLSFILLLSVGITSAYAYSFSKVAPTGQTLYYTIVSSGSSPKVTVTRPSYTWPTGDLTIPSTVTYGGTTYSVTSIGEYAFDRCDLTSVSIPNSVTTIGNYAFHSIDSLSSVTIGNSVTSIGDNAFADCTSLISVTIPNSVTSIGNDAFWYCSSLTSVTIGNSVTSIGNYAFSYCSSLTSVTIGNSVTSIGNYAFEYCSSLTSLTIPNSVTSIGNYAFSECSGLTSINIPNSVTSIGNYAFNHVRHIEYHGTATGAHWGAFSMNGIIDGDFVFSNTYRDTLIGYIGNGGVVTIPNSVTSIGNKAFMNCSGLTSVIIPNSVTSIGN